MRSPSRGHLAATLLIALAIPLALRAQRADTVKITVHVMNQLGLDVPLADVAVRTRDGTVVTHVQSDSEGQAVVTFLKSSNAIQLLVRRLGFQPMAQPLPYPLELSNAVVALLVDAEAPTLDTVHVNSTQALRRRIYFIDSAAIAHSPVPVHDGWEVIKRLRPDIAYGRDGIGICPGVREIYINGEWLKPYTVMADPMVMAREPKASAAAPHIASRSIGNDDHRVQTVNALALIKPEHIAQITYRDCMDKPIAGMHSVNAVFVVLKDGIAFDPATGSFPIRP